MQYLITTQIWNRNQYSQTFHKGIIDFWNLRGINTMKFCLQCTSKYKNVTDNKYRQTEIVIHDILSPVSMVAFFVILLT